MTTYLASHALALAVVASWLVMLGRRSAARRTPQSTFAWLLAFALAPLVAIPLYLALGSRKFPRRAKGGELELPPVRSGCSFELFVTGDRAFAALLELMRSAERAIDLTVFILGDDATGRAVVEALCERARNGVRVRVILDAVGSLKSRRHALQALEAAGAQARLFMPLRHSPWRGRTNLRSHRKIVVVDGVAAFAGGMNMASEYMGPPLPEGAPPRWRDLAAIVRGPAAADAAALFESDWAFCGGTQATALEGLSAPPPAQGTAQVRFVPSGPDMASDTMYDLLLSGIFAARERVAIVTPYFIPDEALQHALVLSARRGVKTELVIPAWSNHRIADVARRPFVRELRASGVCVHYYTLGMVHAKAALIDAAFAYVGSPNFDMRSLFLNYEDAFCLYSTDAIAELRSFVDGLISECTTEPPPFPERRLREQIALLFAPEL